MWGFSQELFAATPRSDTASFTAQRDALPRQHPHLAQIAMAAAHAGSDARLGPGCDDQFELSSHSTSYWTEPRPSTRSTGPQRRERRPAPVTSILTRAAASAVAIDSEPYPTRCSPRSPSSVTRFRQGGYGAATTSTK